MPFYKIDECSKLKDYYRVFATSWPLIFLGPFYVVLKVLLHLSSGAFVGLYFSCSAAAVMLGAPLFYWSRKRSGVGQNARPILLATGLTVMAFAAPLLYYFLSRISGLQALPAVEALSVVVIPWVILCIRPPKSLNERVRAAWKNKHSC